MSETLNKAKSLSKFVYIIDTMNEFERADVARELGHHDFHLFHLHTYEECKAAIVLVMREIPPEMTGKCAFIISNINALTAAAFLQDTSVPEETTQLPRNSKLLKDLMYTIRDARKAGIEVDIIEGPDNT